jgi:dTDP-4-amino-4,6-dideoxygalactose transaminase
VSPAIAIGGVMAAEPERPAIASSVWELWSASFDHHVAYANGRSALAALLRRHGRSRVWLPAYACASLAEGAQAAADVRFYPLSADLELADDAWTAAVTAQDAIVVVDYFGRPPGPRWRELEARHRPPLWIEDRAQALDTGAEPFGDAILFSPRKLFGVGDGGLLFSHLDLPAPTHPGDDGLWRPQDARALDPAGDRPQLWRPSFQAREAAMRVGTSAASGRTLAALGAIAPRPAAERRRANWRRLAEALPEYALWPEQAPLFAPLAFPILAADAATAVQALAAERIWAPRHWADPPSDPAEFADAHWLAARCVSLPIDQRYGEAEMARMIEAVRRLVRPSSRSLPPAPRSRRG